MKAPIGIEALSLQGFSTGPYPPTGFLPVDDAELGNGDYFGLHWPLGRENEEPVVCDLVHDEWRVVPAFANVAAFVRWLEANDWQRGNDLPEDPDFAPLRLARAKAHLAAGRCDEAIVEARAACDSFPDMAESWLLLSRAQQRAGRRREAAQAALAAFRCPWAFGAPGVAVLHLLRATDPQSVDDPVVRRAGSLRLAFGGVKENPDYSLLRECVDEYLARNEPLHALAVSQNLAYAMTGETLAFRERHGFDEAQWRTDFSRLCRDHLGDARASLH